MLKSFNKQELFDLAHNGIMAQGCASMGIYGCQYSATDNEGNKLHCAAGHMMLDSTLEVAENMEVELTNVLDFRQLAGHIYNTEPMSKALTEELITFVMQVQEIHDEIAINTKDSGQSDSTFLYLFNTTMKNFANKHPDLKIM